MIPPSGSGVYLVQTPPLPDGATLATMLAVRAAFEGRGRVVLASIGTPAEATAAIVAAACRGAFPGPLEPGLLRAALARLILVVPEGEPTAPEPWADAGWRWRIRAAACAADRPSEWILGPARPDEAARVWAQELGAATKASVTFWGPSIAAVGRPLDMVVTALGVDGAGTALYRATTASGEEVVRLVVRHGNAIALESAEPAEPASLEAVAPPAAPNRPGGEPPSPIPAPPAGPTAGPAPARRGPKAEPLDELARLVLQVLCDAQEPLSRNGVGKVLQQIRGKASSHARLAQALQVLAARDLIEDEEVYRHGQTMTVWSPAGAPAGPESDAEPGAGEWIDDEGEGEDEDEGEGDDEGEGEGDDDADL